MPNDRISRPLDRNKLAILSGKVKFLESQWKHHRLICSDCALHEDTALRSCNQGWETVKQLAKARNDMLRYTEGGTPGVTPDEGRLF